jgi:hypothetical protein
MFWPDVLQMKDLWPVMENSNRHHQSRDGIRKSWLNKKVLQIKSTRRFWAQKELCPTSISKFIESLQ